MPGLQHHINHGSASADVRPEVAGLNFEFLNGIDGGLNHFNSDLLFVIVKAVQKKIVVGSSQPIDLNRCITPLVFWYASLLHGVTGSLVPN